MKKIIAASFASAVLLSVSSLAFSDHHMGAGKDMPMSAGKDMPMGKGMGMDKCMQMGGQMMDMVDTNKDGKISKEEFTKHHDQMFIQMDKNTDGMIDATERSAMKDQMKGRMDGMKGMDGKEHTHK